MIKLPTGLMLPDSNAQQTLKSLYETLYPILILTTTEVLLSSC